jgi:hypothetical protein
METGWITGTILKKEWIDKTKNFKLELETKDNKQSFLYTQQHQSKEATNWKIGDKFSFLWWKSQKYHFVKKAVQEFEELSQIEQEIPQIRNTKNFLDKLLSASQKKKQNSNCHQEQLEKAEQRIKVLQEENQQLSNELVNQTLMTKKYLQSIQEDKIKSRIKQIESKPGKKDKWDLDYLILLKRLDEDHNSIQEWLTEDLKR